VRKKTRGRGERRNDQFSGLIMSKPDLVMFLEQEKQLWDVKRKETVAIHPAVISLRISSEKEI